jgi:protein-disulfide isomerase
MEMNQSKSAKRKTMTVRTLSKIAVLIAVATLSFGPGLAHAQTKGNKKTVKPSVVSKKENIEKIVREYLLENPVVIREALQVLQQREEMQRSAATSANLKLLKSEIYSDSDSPVIGNAKGDVSIVVFFDYFCGYCKKTMPGLQTLVANDSSVRIVYKELPILGPQSLVAAKAALAAGQQGKFAEFHQAMLDADGAGEDVIKAVSRRLGLDYAKLQADMLDPKIAAAIDRNHRLAEALNVNGTPAYLVGDRIIPGAIDAVSLARLIQDERTKLARLDKEKSGARTTIPATNKGAN